MVSRDDISSGRPRRRGESPLHRGAAFPAVDHSVRLRGRLSADSSRLVESGVHRRMLHAPGSSASCVSGGRCRAPQLSFSDVRAASPIHLSPIPRRGIIGELRLVRNEVSRVTRRRRHASPEENGLCCLRRRSAALQLVLPKDDRALFGLASQAMRCSATALGT